MVRSEQVPFFGADCYNGSPLSFPADATSDLMDSQCWYRDSILAASGFSQVQMNAMCNVTEITQTDVSPEPFNHIPLRTELLIDRFEVNNYESPIERSGFLQHGQQESSRHGGLNNVMSNQWMRMPKVEPISSGSFMNVEWQQDELQHSPAFPLQAVNMNDTHEFQSNFMGEVDTSDVTSKSLSSMSTKFRERSREAESRRKFILKQRVQALQNLLPATLKGKRSSKESVVDDAIGHIKYLQLQVKEMSRSRLGCDSSSGPLRFIEGYGHYQPHEQMFGESLEENFGSLLEENPSAAHKLLESKGLFMVPMASIDALPCNNG